MLKRFVLFFPIFISTVNFAHADDYIELVTYRDQLKQQISTIDSEISRCEKSMKNWKTATIIGGIGAVASGIGIIAQTNQVKEKEKTLKAASQKANEADTEIKALEKVFE